MKKFIYPALVVFAGLCLAENYSISVTSSSTPVLPARNLDKRYVQSWTTNLTVAVGDYCTTNGSIFWCVSAGTTTNAGAGPVAMTGTQTDGTVTWAYVPAGPRKGAVITHDDDNSPIYVSVGVGAVTNSGARLNTEGGAWTIGQEIQGELFAISESGTTNRVSCVDW